MKILISSHKLEDIELICDRAVFLRDGNFVQDVDMKSGAPTDSTVVIVATDEFDKTLAHLNEHHEVIQSLKENNEIILKAQRTTNHY